MKNLRDRDKKLSDRSSCYAIFRPPKPLIATFLSSRKFLNRMAVSIIFGSLALTEYYGKNHGKAVQI
jgi:hypothetical protein